MSKGSKESSHEQERHDHRIIPNVSHLSETNFTNRKSNIVTSTLSSHSSYKDPSIAICSLEKNPSSRVLTVHQLSSARAFQNST